MGALPPPTVINSPESSACLYKDMSKMSYARKWVMADQAVAGMAAVALGR